MVKEYVIKLIENLPDNIKNVKSPLILDLVLDGGVFNGSYLIGALYFLKEMEKQNYIKINRISGCSIGSVAAFLYFIDSLDLMSQLYIIANKEFKETHKLKTIKELKQYLIQHIPSDICDKVNDKFYITYYNIKKGEKKIKSKFKDLDEILDSIIKSCFIPYLIDGNILYQSKYCDGINPYIFNKEPNSKILYLDLFGYDKIGNLLNIKNEKTNYHRILSGMLDIHSFFIKQSNTSMCSYVNEWNFTNYFFYYLKFIIERICVYFTCVLIYLENKVPDEFKSSILSKITIKIIHDVFVILLETYCL
jgi:hypothetical protein